MENKYTYKTLGTAINKNVSALLEELKFNKDKTVGNYLTSCHNEKDFLLHNELITQDVFDVFFVYKKKDEGNNRDYYSGKIVRFEKVKDEENKSL